MTRSSQQEPDIDQIRAAHPGYDITTDPRGRRGVTYHAVARDLATRPGVVVTTSLAELDVALTPRACQLCARAYKLTNVQIGADGRCACGHPAPAAPCALGHAYTVYESGAQSWPAASRGDAVTALRTAGLHRAYVLATHPDGGVCHAEALAVEDDASQQAGR